jgi:hypothetical protein
LAVVLALGVRAILRAFGEHGGEDASLLAAAESVPPV